MEGVTIAFEEKNGGKKQKWKEGKVKMYNGEGSNGGKDKGKTRTRLFGSASAGVDVALFRAHHELGGLWGSDGGLRMST